MKKAETGSEKAEFEPSVLTEYGDADQLTENAAGPSSDGSYTS